MTTDNKKQKYLITSALPYVNGDLHLGHLVGCWLPSDIYARFCRARGRDVLYICGADEHGTPAVVGAMKENMPIIEYNNKYYEKHLRAVRDFNLSFDLYGRTHTELQEKLIHDLFNRLDALGLIEERETVQPFSIDDNMFLADRQLVGTCPKCGYDGARGDQCDNCSATYDASELINPRSTISGSTNIEMRPTKNLFFLASRVQGTWRDWLKSHAPKWSRTAAAIAKQVGVDRFFAEVLPEDKANFVQQAKAEGHTVVMIGDGINDSPALSAADIGIAINSGAAIAREIADVTIKADSLEELVALKAIANSLQKRVHANYRFVLTFNSALIALGALGILQPASSAMLHNLSTIGISLKSMTNLLPENRAPQLKA